LLIETGPSTSLHYPPLSIVCYGLHWKKNDPFPSACANEQRHPIYRHAACRHVSPLKRIMNEPAI